MNKTEKADHAFDLYQEILNTIPEETLRVFKLGHLFKRIRDEKLYKHLDSECSSFKEFCADPKVGYAYSTICSYVKIWEVFIEELHLNMDTLRHIRYKRLQLILPHVSKDPDEWLSRAKEWSHKDLINETRRLKGREPMKEVIKKKALHGGYIEYAKAYGCIHHRNRKPEMAHFPVTNKMGGHKTHVIPLCHLCHQGELHGVGIDTYFGMYKKQIMNYFYDLIKDLYEELNNVREK